MKKYRRSKLMWLGDVIIVLGIIQVAMPEFQQYLPANIPQQAWGLVTALLGLVVKILRAVTVEPVQTFLAPARLPAPGTPGSSTTDEGEGR